MMQNSLTPDEFRRRGEVLFGWGWQTRLAQGLSVDITTVQRWSSGDTPVPGYAVAVLELLDWAGVNAKHSDEMNAHRLPKRWHAAKRKNRGSNKQCADTCEAHRVKLTVNQQMLLISDAADQAKSLRGQLEVLKAEGGDVHPGLVDPILKELLQVSIIVSSYL